MQRVVEELRTHCTALQELESTLIDRLTALDSEEAKHRDEAAEAELRATVGELASEHFTEVTERTSGAIAGLSEERGRVQAELSQLRHLLDVGHCAASGRGSRAGAPARRTIRRPSSRAFDSSIRAHRRRCRIPMRPPHRRPRIGSSRSRTPSAAIPRRRRVPSGPRAVEKAPERAQEANPFDDLEFLKTMVDRNSGEHAVVNPTREHSPEPVASAPQPDHLETMPTAPPVKQRPSKPLPVAASGLPLIMPDAPAPPRVEPRFPQSDAVATPPCRAYLKESPPEQVKTLKCQECGTLNYPTEWYCERCGAELAAL